MTISQITLVSAAADGTLGNQDADIFPFVSADGRYVVFASNASNLVAGDTNAAEDIFVKDLSTGAIQRVSTAADGTQGGDASSDPFISTDGRYVVFKSYASNLVGGDTGWSLDLFVKDLATGAIQRVSTGASDTHGSIPPISADGRYVLFESDDATLVAGDTNMAPDIFLRDLVGGTLQLVSSSAAGIQGNYDSSYPQISADGRYAVFESWASNLVAGDTNLSWDIFVKDLGTGAIQRVSTAADGTQGNQHSYGAQISADGRFVVFQGPSSNLVAGDTNGAQDIFVKEIASGAITRVSTAADGAQGNGGSYSPQISGDGRFVVFTSDASNLVAGDTNLAQDIFVKDLSNGAIQRLSVAADGTQGNFDSYTPHISADGRLVVFNTDASNLVANDTNLRADIFAVANPLFLNVTLVGGAGDDLLVGGAGNDSLAGVAGNDTLQGLGGDDSLDGGEGADRMEGGQGADTYYVDDTGDECFEADNTPSGTSGFQLGVDLGGITDTVVASVNYALGNYLENLTLAGAANLAGTGNALANAMTGNGGGNTLNGGSGNDTLRGGLGNDVLQGAAGNDKLYGEGGNDNLNGAAGNDLLNGGGGTDTATYATAGAGVTVTLTLPAAQNTVGAGTDTLTGIENLTGSAFNDTLTGDVLANRLDGAAGNDTLDGGAGNDLLLGGDGIDTATYAAAGAGVTVNLTLATAQNTGGAGTDTLTGIENLTGSAYADTLTGATGTNVIRGGAGGDILNGLGGKDALTGNGGNDVFVLGHPTASDTITDFMTGSDDIRVRMSAIAVGDGDTVVENAATVAGPDGFATAAELVIVTANLASITAANAATAIGSAAGAYADGDKRLFVVDNGTSSALFLFTSSGADAAVSAAELTQLATLSNAAATTLGDYLFAN